MASWKMAPAVLGALLSACSVNIDPLPDPSADGGTPAGSDGSIVVVGDTGTSPGLDAGSGSRDTGGTASPDTGTSPGLDAAAPAGPDAATDPCASLTCGSNAHCDPSPTPHCACSAGFTDDGSGGCTPVDPGDPSLHTQQQVCDAYKAGIVSATGTVFTPGATECDKGTLSREGIDEAVRRLNMHRYFIGVGPLTDDPSPGGGNDAAQACAVISAWNPAGPTAHYPDPSAKCYSSLGAGGAGSSNIAWGCGTPGGAIDQWIDDWGNETTMGHRRWFLRPSYQPMGIGLYVGGNNYGSAACATVFSGGNTGRSPAWWAYPGPGFFPVAYANYTWTVHGQFPSAATAEVTRVSDGSKLAVSVVFLQGSYGNDTAISLQRQGWSAAAGETYHVKLTGGASGTDTLEYDVKPVDCP